MSKEVNFLVTIFLTSGEELRVDMTEKQLKNLLGKGFFSRKPIVDFVGGGVRRESIDRFYFYLYSKEE